MAYPPAMDTHPTLPQELWERTPPEVQAYIEVLEARQASMGALETRVVALEALVQALQEQLNQTSQNSSRPPSSDPPQHPHPRRSRGTRRRGGQPGHPGHTRTLLPVEAVDEVVVLKPAECPQCHAPFSGDDPKLWRHQVSEIPPITPVVTEYQWHQLVCAACGAVPRASWPMGVPSGTYGPRVQATVALYTGAYRFSKRTTQQMMDDVLGVPVRVGTISLLERATTAAVAAPVEEARTYVHTQEVAHLDETRGHQGDKQAWLWVAVTTWVTGWVVRLSRGGQVARELWGETCAGVLVTDRYRAYTWYPVRWRQLCWAPLLRDFAAMCARGGASAELGEALLAQAPQMFTGWHRVREGT
jgi:transposase